MSDGRFPEQWLNSASFGRMSPEAQMLFVVGNTWSASNRTDGWITVQDLETFPRWVHIECVPELEASGRWVPMSDGWQVAGYEHHQTTRAQLESAEVARASARDRQARKRVRDRKPS